MTSDELRRQLGLLKSESQDLRRNVWNDLWRQGGCELVRATEDQSGLTCPVCGNRPSSGTRNIPTIVSIEPVIVANIECGQCGHEWESRIGEVSE